MSVSGKINVSALSFDEKMTLLSELAKSLVGQGSSVKTTKTEVKTTAKKEKDPDAPKREATPLFKARTAYIAQIKVSHAERFAEEKAAGIKYLTTAKSIIDEDKTAFDDFVAEFIASAGSSPSNASAAPAPAPAPAPAAATPKKLSAADLKKAAEAKKTSASSATPPKPTAAKPASAPAAPKKPVKTVAPKAPAPDESLAKTEIDGEEYLRDTKTQALWKLDEDGHQGPFVGYYEDEAIRYAEHPEDE
jgi:hypothetical protein